ncbi:MAG: Eco57I restriction-modification methylase domain-containing protein, partial [Trebonia sp.]
ELFSDEIIFSQSNAELAASLAQITHAPGGSLRDVHRQAAAYREWAESDHRQRKLDIADAWCAAFVWRKHPAAPPAIVNRVFQALSERGRIAIPPGTAMEMDRLRDEYAFFHWHLEFPDVFQVPDGEGTGIDPDTGWTGGFSVLLGNPPWDKVDFEDKKYFSAVEPTIAEMAGQKRRSRIKQWEREHPEEGERYRASRRRVKSTFLFASSSSRYPQCARGLTAPGVTMMQIDQLFAELFAVLTAPFGRAGAIIPTAIATGAGGQYLFADFTKRSGVASLYDFENRKPLFPAVDSRYKFCLLSMAGKALREPAARLAFFLLDTPDLDEPGRAFALTPEDLALINPNTGTLPIFRNRKDAALTAEIYRRVPVLWNESERDGNLWKIDFKATFFHMTDDSDLFRTREQLERDSWRLRGNVFTRDGKRMLPLYEAKMVDFFNHRAADVVKSETALNRQNQPQYVPDQELRDPSRCAVSLNWIAEDGLIPTERNGKKTQIPGVAERLADVRWDQGWLCGWCDVTSSTNERTAIPVFIPRTAAGHTFPLMLPRVSPVLAAALIATQSSLVFDFVSRQKIGSTHMNLFVWKQLPVPTPAMLEPHLPFIVPRVLELVYTAYDMTPLARDLGDEGEPFRWDEGRRAQLRAELDAFFFRMYGIDNRDDVDYILETFQTDSGGLKHNEIRDHGDYRTKRLVLAEYDRMAAAEAAGISYESPLELPPGQGPRHPASRRPAGLDAAGGNG